jgi:hypothetical protein
MRSTNPPARAKPTETKGRIMLIDQSKPNGVPREKMSILATAMDDLKGFDNSVQMRLLTELRKHYFSLEHVETRISKAHYRVRFGDYRGTVFKDHDRYYLMRIFSKNNDQRSYITSLRPTDQELMDARPLPDPVESETAVAESATVKHAAQNGEALANGAASANHSVWAVPEAERLPLAVQEAMQKLQTVFVDLYREQVGMLETVTEVNELAARNEKSQHDDQQRVDSVFESLEALKRSLRELQAQSDQLSAHIQKSTENFDGAIEIALGQIQTLDAKFNELQDGLQRNTDAIGTIHGRLDALATLSDWKRAYPDLPKWLAQLEDHQAELQRQAQADRNAALSKAVLITTWQTEQEQRELELSQRCQSLESAIIPRNDIEAWFADRQQHGHRLQSRLEQLETRLERAERRSFWQWLTGR